MGDHNALQGGKNYKLTYYVGNPEAIGRSRSGDWRTHLSWSSGTVFHCYEVYYDGGMVTALYAGNRPQDCVHRFCDATLFNAISNYLVPA